MSNVKTAKRLWRNYIRDYLPHIGAMVALMLLVSGTTSAQPLLLQIAFDKVFTEKNLTYLTLMPLAIVGICLAQAVATYYSNVLVSKFGNALIADFRRDLFRHTIENEIEFYATYDQGSLLSRLTGEIIGLSNGIQMFFNAWVRQFITSCGLIVVMLYQSVELTIIVFLAMAFALHPIVRFTKRFKEIVRLSNEKTAKFNARLLESLQGVKVIKSFAKEDFEIRKIGGYIGDMHQLNDKLIKTANVVPAIMQTLAGVAVAFVLWYGGYQLIEGRMTQGNLIAFIASLLMASKPMRALTSSGAVITAALLHAERFYRIMDTKPRYESRDAGEIMQVTRGEIVFDGVSFNYPGGARALSNVSFTIEAGKKTALVGHSGSGKSTVFNLILKFYHPTAGVLRIDGQDVEKSSIRSLRAGISLVSQDVFIFDETARNNIAYGREGATEEEIIAAAKAARCHDFIMAMPQGYDTPLGFLGQNLSGGQKQRIAIARAFLRNAPILLLDEATSALDPKTEGEVQAAIEQLTEGRTTVIIAHRLSTVMNADRMILMDQGYVRAIGRHEELLAGSPEYRDLFGI